MKLRRGLSFSATLFLLIGLTLTPRALSADAQYPSPERPAALAADAAPLKGSSVNAHDVARLALLEGLNIKISDLDLSAKEMEETATKTRYDTTFAAEGAYTWEEEQQPSIVLGERNIVGLGKAGLSKQFPLGLEAELYYEAKRNSSTSSFSSFNPNYESHSGLRVRQPLAKNFLGLIDRSEVERVRLDISRFQEETLARVEQFVFEARQAYWDYLRDVKLFRLVDENLSLSQQFFDVTRNNLETGLAEEQDLYAVEANVRNRINDLLTAQLNAQLSMNKLKLSLYHQQDLIPVKGEALPDDPVTLEGLMLDALETRRDYRAKLLTLESQGIAVKVQKMNRLPDFDLIAEVGSNALDRDHKNAQGEIFGFNHNRYFLGFELSIPLENRTARADYKIARIDEERITLELEHLAYRIQLEIEDAYRELLTHREQVEQARAVEALQRKKLQAEEKQFRVGRSSSKTMIDYQEDSLLAQITALRSQIAYEKAKDNLLFAQHQLLQKLGLTFDRSRDA